MFRLFHVLVIVFFLMLNNLLAFGSMASVALTERPESAGAVGILIGAVTALCVLYCLAALIPSLVGGIWLLVLFCQDSQPGANRWGANPKE